MQLASPKLVPRDFDDVGKPGQGRVRCVWFLLFIIGRIFGKGVVIIWCKGGGGVSVNCIIERKGEMNYVGKIKKIKKG